MNLIPFAAVFTILFFASMLYLCRGLKIGVRQLAYSSMTCALVLLLSYLRITLPIGTAITFEYLPLILLALLVDPRLSMVTGLACGVLSAMLSPGWSMIHWAQLPLEQLLCFACLGYAGLFGMKKRSRAICGVLLAMALKLTGHVLSGAIFYGQFAWEGWGPLGYSLVYNCSYMIPNCIIAVLAVRFLPLENLYKAIHKGAAA